LFRRRNQLHIMATFSEQFLWMGFLK
jgi:hypothetical protein